MEVINYTYSNMYIEDICALVYFFPVLSCTSRAPELPWLRGAEESRGSRRALGCCGAPPWGNAAAAIGLQKGLHRSHSSSPALPQLCPCCCAVWTPAKMPSPAPGAQPGGASRPPLCLEQLGHPLSTLPSLWRLHALLHKIKPGVSGGAETHWSN